MKKYLQSSGELKCVFDGSEEEFFQEGFMVYGRFPSSITLILFQISPSLR